MAKLKLAHFFIRYYLKFIKKLHVPSLEYLQEDFAILKLMKAERQDSKI